MTFFYRPTQSKPTATKHNAKQTPSDAKALRLQHLDYDLQPLRVESLSHYIAPRVEDERFRVH